MKKLALLIGIALLAIACDSDEKTTIDFSKLPTKSQEFVQTHFSDKNISVIYKERETFGKEYEVIFSDGANIDFNTHGDWTEVEDKDFNGVPVAIIPANILSYVNAKHPSDFIVKIDKDNDGYEVTLNNFIELDFDLNENFIGYESVTNGEIKKSVVTASTLPVTISDFINTYFADKQIIVVYKEDKINPDYEIIFSDGAKIEFDFNGNWEEIEDRDADGVPTALIPSAILSYVNQNHTNNYIIKIEKDKKGYEIKLDNFNEIEFDLNGNFIKYDSKENQNNNTTINLSNLPITSQNIINTYFANKQIATIKTDKDFFNTDYEVKFTDGSEIEFNSNGDWKEIKEKINGVPNGLIPASINSFVNQNHSTNFIIKIEKDKKGYDVELNNDLEIEFDLNGNFIRYDD